MANPMDKLQALKALMAKAKGKGKSSKGKGAPPAPMNAPQAGPPVEPDGDEMLTRPGIPMGKGRK